MPHEAVPAETVETFLASLKRCLAEPEFMMRFIVWILVKTLYRIAADCRAQQSSMARAPPPRGCRRRTA